MLEWQINRRHVHLGAGGGERENLRDVHLGGEGKSARCPFGGRGKICEMSIWKDSETTEEICFSLKIHWFWYSVQKRSMHYHHLIFTYPLTAGAVGAPQLTSQPVSPVSFCSPLPSGTWRTPGLSIPWCLTTSFSVCLVFFPLSLCLARLFWPFSQTWWTEDMSISLKFASLYNGQEVFVCPIACRILAQTSSLVTCSLYEMRSTLR